MVYTKEYKITTDRDSLQDIAAEVNETIKESGIRNGIVTVETTEEATGIFKIASLGKEVQDDIVREMRRIVPARINFYHQDSPENAAGQIKNCLFGSSVSLILKEGKLLCEGKQIVCYADYDGPRERSYHVCVIGEKE
ncbi:MAG: secondary thiamine-phosphate synthase enzyme YjbQ [Erysipelotrichaceae bacterium]|nr:secondary thiamine-phosphate synthase enzyme YjbQ [Erysipelotrichaceae bacterium]